MRAIFRAVRRAFHASQSFVGGLYSLLLPLSLLTLFVANLALLWVGVFRPIDPVSSHRIVSVDPDNQYLDRDHVTEFTVSREVCSSRDQKIEVVRSWTEGRYSGQARPIVVFSVVFHELKKGCNLVVFRQRVPETLPPALYVYSVNYRSCNLLSQCATRFLDDIHFAVLGGETWRNLDVHLPPVTRLPLPTTPGPTRGGFGR